VLELIFIGTFGYCHGVTHHNVWETTVLFLGLFSEEGNCVTKIRGGEEYPTNSKREEGLLDRPHLA
jgi:hypothetical protein